MKLLRHLLLIVLALFLVVPRTVRANDVYFDCVVIEHLRLTKEGYRPYPAWSSRVGDHLTINKQTGAIRGDFFHPGGQNVIRLRCLHVERVCLRWHARERSYRN